LYTPTGNWKKASWSVAEGACVEVAPVQDGVLVRNSKDRTGPIVRFTDAEWKAFVAGVKDGEFDALA
jgi:hypothetical protein